MHDEPAVSDVCACRVAAFCLGFCRGRGGVPINHIRALTQHKVPGVIGVHARHDYEAEKRGAMRTRFGPDETLAIRLSQEPIAPRAASNTPVRIASRSARCLSR